MGEVPRTMLSKNLDKLSCTCVYDDMHDACHVFLLTESLSIKQLAAHLRLLSALEVWLGPRPH